MSKRKNKRYARNEFRYNYKTKHPNYIFEEDGQKYHAIGITHKRKTFGKFNTTLSYNIQENKTGKSRLRNGIITSNKNSFSSTRTGYRFHKEDMPKVRAKIKLYKNNRRKK